MLHWFKLQRALDPESSLMVGFAQRAFSLLLQRRSYPSPRYCELRHNPAISHLSTFLVFTSSFGLRALYHCRSALKSHA